MGGGSLVGRSVDAVNRRLWEEVSRRDLHVDAYSVESPGLYQGAHWRCLLLGYLEAVKERR